MKRRAILLAALALLATAPVSLAQGLASAGRGLVTIDVLDVGQGDAVLVRTPEGKSALIDAGPSHHIVSMLRQQGVASLDLVALSHHHADHYGGMAEVVRTFHPRLFLDSGSPHTSEHYLRLIQLVRDERIPTITPTQAARQVQLGSVTLTVFPRAPNDPKEENNNSVGLRLQHGGFSMLLPGDAEVNERRWWERTVPNLVAGATVLKLAHHGSRNGTDARWLGLVRPRLAVASLGKNNEFHHPHPETLALLARSGIPLLRTDRDGLITIRTDGRTWKVLSHPHIPTGPPLPPPDRSHDSAGPHGKAVPLPGSISLNRAGEDALRTIPGIGPVLAKRIIAARPYRSVDDLQRVEGIGPKRLADIRVYLSVD
jgi:beta-lactamase superfamily II metal-dependent hydrolase